MLFISVFYRKGKTFFRLTYILGIKFVCALTKIKPASS